MQIIQSIRDKGAAIVIGVIALSLIGFILMDAQQGGSRLFSSFSSTIGKVNGEKIELNEFNKKVEEAEDAQYQRTGQRATGVQLYQMRDQVWNQLVAERLFFGEASKLSISLSAKELNYILYSEDPSNPLTQEASLKDSVTGRLDPVKVKKALENIKKQKGEMRERIQRQLIDPLELNKVVSKYSSLLSAGSYYPSWMQTADENSSKAFSNISFVNIPYSEISDSAVKVTDEDVKEYVSKNKGLFKQEAGRYISYISFSQKPSNTDSSNVRESLNNLKAAFAVDSNAKAFIANNQSVLEFKDQYTPQSKLFFMIKDTIAKLPIGSVYGPYNENNNFVLAKLLGKKDIPDSVKARHILVKTGEGAKMDDSAAKKLADSILAAVKSGSSFDSLAAKFSDDESNKNKGGDLGYFTYGTMVPEFNDFCFSKSPGSKEVVKTNFGYHVVEIMGAKNPSPAYKIAYMAKEVIASEETINKASLDATRASSIKDRASLEKLAEKSGLSLTKNSGLVKENDYSVGALQDARSVVRWAFGASVGDISESFSIGDQFVVAVLDKIVDEGTQDAETARPGCESTIRNKKKAAIIGKKLGSNPTLEKAASAYNKTIQNAGADSTLTFSSSVINNVGMEQKVIGAAFNKEYQSKTSPMIEGNSGVFILKINSIEQKTADTPEAIAENAKQKLSSMRSQTGGWYESLKKQAKIDDNRFDHF